MSTKKKYSSTKRKFKVCQIITKMVYGGASLETLYLAENLDHKCFNVSIICGSQSKDEGSLLSRIDNRNINVVIIPEIVREINPIQDIIALFKLISILKRNKYDIVHTHGSKTGFIGRLAAAYCRVPRILYSVHGWGLKAETSFSRSLLRLIEKVIALCTDKILFVTKSDMKEAFSYKIGRQTQYYLTGFGTNLEPFLNYDRQRSIQIRKELNLENQRIVGIVGRVSPQKNPIGFINIAQEVLKVKNDVVFLFVGGGELLGKMRDIVRDLNLTKKIIFLGVRKDIPEILANFDIFILPSLWEGLPLSLIEAMAMSKPVIVHKVDGIEEFIKNGINGVVVPLNQVKEFSDKVIYLLDNPKFCRETGRRAKMIAKNYNYKKVAKKIEMLYKQLISKIA